MNVCSPQVDARHRTLAPFQPMRQETHKHKTHGLILGFLLFRRRDCDPCRDTSGIGAASTGLCGKISVPKSRLTCQASLVALPGTNVLFVPVSSLTMLARRHRAPPFACTARKNRSPGLLVA